MDAPASVGDSQPIVERASADLPGAVLPLQTSQPSVEAKRPQGFLLLTTKLYVPHTRPTLLSRRRLLDRLELVCNAR